MQHGDSGTSVVVGVDGSPSSVHAAEWAIDEAVSRDVPLRLIHVIQSTSADVGREREEGELALQDAHSAITRHGRKVKVETEIMRGHVAATLVAESVGAAMICLGSAGGDLEAAKFAGTTATAVARAA
ncbi:MAG: universal stress protein, partial [Rhodococcus fascians]